MKTKRISAALSLFVALCLLLSMQAFAFSQADVPSGSYTVPITGLSTKAPLPPIQKAFAGAFGSAVAVTADGNGNLTAAITNEHMTIAVLGRTYEANVLTVEGAQIVSTKTEKFSNPVNGILGDPQVEDETVPAVFRLPLALDANGAQVLSITVDFMDQFMGKGDSHPMNVTLTLDTSAFPQKAAVTTTTAPTTEATTAAPMTTLPQTAAQPVTEPETVAPTTEVRSEEATEIEVPETTQAPTAASAVETVSPAAPAPAKRSPLRVILGVFGLLAALAAVVYLIVEGVRSKKTYANL